MKKLLSVFLLFIIFTTFETEALAMTPADAAAMDLGTPSGLSAEELRAGLKKSLPEFAEDFIAAEEKYGVNAVFLAALAAFESGWGRHCFRENNIFGWSGKSFETKAECIDFVASRIAEHYLSEDGKYYHGMDLYGVNHSYNGNAEWVEKIAGIMSKITEKAESYAAAQLSFEVDENLPEFIEPEEHDKPCSEDEPEGSEKRYSGGVIVIGAH